MELVKVAYAVVLLRDSARSLTLQMSTLNFLLLIRVRGPPSMVEVALPIILESINYDMEGLESFLLSLDDQAF